MNRGILVIDLIKLNLKLVSFGNPTEYILFNKFKILSYLKDGDILYEIWIKGELFAFKSQSLEDLFKLSLQDFIFYSNLLGSASQQELEEL